MQMPNAITTYVGTDEALDYLYQHHPRYELPGEELFAFARRHGTNRVMYIIVGENDPDLEAKACQWMGRHNMTDAEFENLQRTIVAEARACQIEAPYSVTLVNKTGAFSFCMRRRTRKKQVAA